MIRHESALVAAILCTAFSLAVGIGAWWFAAALFMLKWIQMDERTIPLVTLVGLMAGVAGGVFRFRDIASRVYTLPWRPLIALFVTWSIILHAFFMGFPFGAMALGLLVALYVGRRSAHARTGAEQLLRVAPVAIGGVIGGEALVLGSLGALFDPFTWRWLLSFAGAESVAENATLSLLAVVFLAGALAVFEARIANFLARRASLWAA